MTRTRSNFQMILELSDRDNYSDYIIDELLTTTVTVRTQKIAQACNSFSKAEVSPEKNGSNGKRFKGEVSQTKKVTNPEDRFPRTRLLLSPNEMLRENYPFLSLTAGIGPCNFVYTKDEYIPVTPASPMFAVDCEMCITTTGASELTRVSIVDEKLTMIYDTLVKPDNQITNYLTQFSGITPELMKDVTTRLADVQAKIREMLPPDAILCGQSLNSDLNALKMIHPYVIDTSVIYNLSGIRRRKSSLKMLSAMFLKEEIQNNNSEGHCSIEDSSATMKLVLLKLRKGIDFGDVILYNSRLASVKEENVVKSKQCEQKSKKVVLIRGYDNLKTKRGYYESVRVVKASDDGGVMTETLHRAIHNDLTISQIRASEKGGNYGLSYSSLDVQLSNIFESCASNALVVIICGPSYEDNSNGLCMIGLKLNGM